MTEAFDAACEKLGDIDQPEVAREVIAGRIIAGARLGERDPARLLAAALADRTSLTFRSREKGTRRPRGGARVPDRLHWTIRSVQAGNFCLYVT
jgi:hypothetical protein